MLASLLLVVAVMSPACLAPRVVEVQVGPVQKEILRAIRQPTTRFLDVEGALRSAKTWTVLIAIRSVLADAPGIHWAMARWTEGDLNQKLLPDWRNVCALMGLSPGTWNAKESCYDFDNASRIYAVHLKRAQTDNRYAAVRGLTVAGFYLDQAEELTQAEDVYVECALRLSQPGYAQQIVISPNPVPETHWIAKRWPVRNTHADHRYIRVAMRDNRHNLDPATIAAAEALYPVGHPLRATKLDGRRGLEVRGTPVYSGAFSRSRHVQADLPLWRDLPLYESYDYGFHHPCVVWFQWAPWGHLRVLGGVMGSDLHLDRFLPIVERYRGLWFPERGRLQVTCDPAGANENAQGLRGTPVGLLADWYREHGERTDDGRPVVPIFQTDANHPERRVAATQKAATYFQRRVHGVEAFLVDPERWVLAELNDERHDSFFIDGLEAGYVLEDEPRHSAKLGTYSVPKKDGWFEHAMNCFEYGLQSFVLDLPLGDLHSEEAKIRHAQQKRRDDLIALKQSQQDKDPDDPPRLARGIGRRVGSGRPVRRGGY